MLNIVVSFLYNISRDTNKGSTDHHITFFMKQNLKYHKYLQPNIGECAHETDLTAIYILIERA